MTKANQADLSCIGLLGPETTVRWLNGWKSGGAAIPAVGLWSTGPDDREERVGPKYTTPEHRWAADLRQEGDCKGAGALHRKAAYTPGAWSVCRNTAQAEFLREAGRQLP